MSRADLEPSDERAFKSPLVAKDDTNEASVSAGQNRTGLSMRLRIAVGATLLLSVVFCVYRMAPILWIQLGDRTAGAEAASTPISDNDWQMAMQSLDVHETSAARDYIRRSLGREALRARRALLQGRLFLENGQLYAARHALLEARDDATIRPVASYWLGATSYAMSDTRAAEEYWLATLDSLPRDANTHRSLAMIYYDRGAIDHAVQHLKEVASIVPSDARPYRLLGLIHKDYERYGEAAEFYRAALDRDLAAQTREQVRRELTECLLKTREYEAGLAVLEHASMTYDAIVLKAECLVGLGRSEEAADLLKDVLSRDARHFGAQVAMAGIYLEQMKYAEAVELLRRAVELKPAEYLAHFRLAQALRSLGEAEEASAVQQRADEIKAQRERFSKLHQEATAKPEDAEVRYQLGQLAAELDLPELATTWYRAALELDPKHEAARKALTSSASSANATQASDELSQP